MNTLVRDSAMLAGEHQEASFLSAETRIPIASERREYRPGEASGYRMVIAATGNREVDYRVANDASDSGILINVADDARPSNMLFPAIHRDRRVSVSVSTEGASPALASWLRNYIQQKLPPYLGVLAELLSQARRDLHDAHRSTEGIKWHEVISNIYSTDESLGLAGRSTEPADRFADRARKSIGALLDQTKDR
jgi:siroheme synthase-like protein